MAVLPLEEPFAVFSDVHRNLPALVAVLADVNARGYAQALCLGDLIGYGPSPNEVVALVHAWGISTLLGNYDQGIGFELDSCGCAYATEEQRLEGDVSFDWTRQAVTQEVKAQLRALADRFVLQTPCGELLAVHGSPRRINEYLFEDRPVSALERMARANPYRAILFGHTHRPYVRRVGGMVFANVGSVGRPKDGDWRACYATVDPSSRTAGSPVVEFVRVEYDYAQLLRDLGTTPLITSFDGPFDSGKSAERQ